MECKYKCLKVHCLNCNILYPKRIAEIRRSKADFCSRECHFNYRRIKERENNSVCLNCGKSFYKLMSEIRKSRKHFCSRNCAASHNNRNKTYGTRVSKLEKFIQEKLTSEYPYDFHFNRRDTINSELDIYIPELKLAFELNGIFHYAPIHGAEKLDRIRNNDCRKFQACLEVGIELCVIDTSWITYSSPQDVKGFWNN